MSDVLRTHVVDLLNHSSKPPMTIVHGDYRLDNLFFGTNGVAVIDWQVAHRGRGVFDVAYFLSGCLEPAARRAEEMRLLHLWYELATDGGHGYAFEDALRDYRRAVLYCHVYTVIAIGSLDPANERGMRVFQGWLRRRNAAIEELEAYALMPTYFSWNLQEQVIPPSCCRFKVSPVLTAGRLLDRDTQPRIGFPRHFAPGRSIMGE